jgi:hypothetical protein
MRKKVKIAGAIAGLGIVLMATLTFAQQLNTVIDSFASPGSIPTGLAWDGQYLWNADKSDYKIYKIQTYGVRIKKIYTTPDKETDTPKTSFRPGDPICFKITYDFTGVRDGSSYMVEREVRDSNNELLASLSTKGEFEKRWDRTVYAGPGTIPKNAKVGTYTVIGKVKVGSLVAEKQTEFKVEVPGGRVSSKETAAVTRFKTLKYIDKQEGMGIEAFRMLIPSDWQFEGGIKWVLDNPRLPAVAGFRVGNPKGAEEFEVFPTQAFFWTDNETVLSMFPIGSRYFGNEVYPLVKPIEALKQIVIPRFRGNVSNLRTINEKPVPELAEAVGAGTQSQPGVFSSAEAAKIRIEYNLNGMDMEEEIYTVIQSHSFPVQVWGQMRTHTNWYVDYILSFKAEKGKLDANSKTFQTIAYSFELNPLWFSKFIQVVEYLIKNEIHIIKSWGELGRILSQTGSEIRDEDMDRWNQRQAANDKMVDNFCQYIRGVEKYYNPIEEKTVELPSGYQNAWTNSLGDYYVSHSPSFDPNIGSPINWHRIKKVQ